MKTKNKAMITVLSVGLLVAALAFGTLAYFTDHDAVTNTFTVGNVDIILDEADVNEDGTYVEDEDQRVKENTYHLIPGHTYIKDPTIHVDADSEDCYLFVKVENGIKDIETKTKTGKTIANQMEELGWVAVPGYDNLYVFAKESDKYDKYVLSRGANVVVFNDFTIDGDSVDNEKIDGYKDATVVVTAYAVQKDGFENSTPEQIWEATFGK